VSHPLLSEGTIEARAYQLEAVDEALSGSMMLVLPTAAGKTAVAWMAIVESLNRNGGWALMVAPTVALVQQHLNGISEVIDLKGRTEAISVTGKDPPSKRDGVWGSSKLIVATPQVVRNDVERGALDLSDCCILVLDEVHHCTGSHAMAMVTDMYLSMREEPLILGATASPGYRAEDVREVCSRMRAGRIHIRGPDEPMLSEYLSELEVDEISVRVPQEIRDLAEPLILWQTGIVDQQRRLGRYVMTGAISYSGLSNAMDRSQVAISRGESSAYKSMSQIATAMRLHHLINCLLSQGISASKEFLDRMENEEEGRKKSVLAFLRDPRIRDIRKKLSGMEESHTKMGAVRRLVRERIRRDNDSRVIVFATYRDTINSLDRALVGLDGVRSIQFVGQSRRGGREGLSPKRQVERLDSFRSGESNVLLATSIGEEGLDIPAADLVIFYEPVSSEIRTIQRRGRTGRRRLGEVVVLIAEDTRDEGSMAAAKRKEQGMQRAVHRVRRGLPRGHHSDLSNLGSFTVLGESRIPASDFVVAERDRNRPELIEEDKADAPIGTRIRTGPLDPSTFRPRGQSGLEDF
tara:strand:- start:13262 stop:14995 length:1734 start_codon:yes stop_codon:yes gene_type:complete